MSYKQFTCISSEIERDCAGVRQQSICYKRLQYSSRYVIDTVVIADFP